MLINIILALANTLPIEHRPKPWLLTHRSKALGQNNQLMSWDLILLDRLPDYLFGNTVAIHIGCIPGVEAAIVCCLQEGQGLVFCVSKNLPCKKGKIGRKRREENLLLIQNPRCPIRMPNAHRPKNRDRNAQSTLPKIDILGFALFD